MDEDNQLPCSARCVCLTEISSRLGPIFKMCILYAISLHISQRRRVVFPLGLFVRLIIEIVAVVVL